MAEHIKLCVGLTGGIGSGKSTVAQMFQRRGASIIDTDVIAHQLTQANGFAIAALRSTFGTEYLTPQGALDRAKMRTKIFSDSEAKQQLQAILHPLILAQSQILLAQTPAQTYAILVVPLLLQSPEFQSLVQRVLVVDCSEERQIERVMRRSQLDESQIRLIMAQQSTRQQRLDAADDVIHNNGDLASLQQQVADLHRVYFA